MLTSLTNQLRRREAGEKGFTLIELLVVIIIIAILAAIAIPLFMNQQKSAYASTLKSDVRNSVDSVMDASKGVPSFDDLPTVFTRGADTRVVSQDHPSENGAFVIYGYSGAAETGICYDSTTGKVSEETCPEPNPAQERAEEDEEAGSGGNEACFSEMDSAYGMGYDSGPWFMDIAEFESATGGALSSTFPGCESEWNRGKSDADSGAGYNP